MDGLWTLYGMVVLGGITVPSGLAQAERHISAERVRAALGGTDRTPALRGMLAGGPGRVVDALATGLVERGELRAEDVRLRRPSAKEAEEESARRTGALLPRTAAGRSAARRRPGPPSHPGRPCGDDPGPAARSGRGPLRPRRVPGGGRGRSTSRPRSTGSRPPLLNPGSAEEEHLE
ncbi:hypothetical protein GCM10009760_49010 [Kitasatospora kazusensis]|uniref:Uncharacterized protein n=1 Tax=Kitasatospora kazusensis TaxID=407974 RepID=A0ABP5LRD6_9ACTN